jgi:hypothetical protein
MGIFISLIVYRYPNHGAGYIDDGERILRNLTIYVRVMVPGMFMSIFLDIPFGWLEFVGLSAAYMSPIYDF